MHRSVLGDVVKLAFPLPHQCIASAYISDLVDVATQALVRWGGALLELAHYKQGSESTDMIEQVRCSIGSAAARPVLHLHLSHALTYRGALLPINPRNVNLQAISKLQQSLLMEPDNTDAYWCLGNAHTSLVSRSRAIYACSYK
jgi:hypothetical protein